MVESDTLGTLFKQNKPNGPLPCLHVKGVFIIRSLRPCLERARLAQQGFLTPCDLLDIAVNPKHAVTFPDGTTTIPDQSPSPASAPASP